MKKKIIKEVSPEEEVVLTYEEQKIADGWTKNVDGNWSAPKKKSNCC